MRSKYLIGLAAGVAGALALSGVASAAAPTSQNLQVTFSPTKQDKKRFGGVSAHISLATTYPDFINSPSPQQTVFTLDPNVKFVNGNLPPCPLSSIQGRPSAVARSACPGSITGQGIVQANNGLISGVATLFTGGPNLIYVHSDLGAGALIIPITGTISGRTVTFSGIPNTPGTSLTLFDVTFNKTRTSSKRKGNFYVMARCKKKSWNISETTTFYNGQSLSASSTQRCKGTGGKK
jgi:hypothetical protein